MKTLRIQSGDLSWSARAFWLRRDLYHLARPVPRELGYTGDNQWVTRREYGGWVIRPASGWRRLRWVTPPLHYTRSIPAGDQEAAALWGYEKVAA
jgi:hypothetical protein